MAEGLFLLIDALRSPARVLDWNETQWSYTLSLARRENLLGHLAAELDRAGLLHGLSDRLQALCCPQPCP
jgi:hypothetical protein